VFAHHEVRDGVGTAVTDRHGGVSTGAWGSLNLADHVGDDPVAVAANRQRLADALGPTVAALVPMRQVHGADVAVVGELPSEPPEVDALVTAAPGLALLVLVADCTPVLLADRSAGVVAAVHAGRRGLALGVVPAAIDAMCSLGARTDRLEAVLGPGICPAHYEVPAEMRDEVVAAAPAARAETPAGTPALDIGAGIVEQLRAAGVDDRTVLGPCTAESDDLFSHRRDRVTGRFAGLVWIQP
jgi:YfiH family protein